MDRSTVLLGGVAVTALAALLFAGPLTPPAGPIASTYKTLQEVEPRIAISATNTPGDPLGDPSPSVFKITQPGSYYLTGNVTGVVGMHGIEIVASGVTIDLNGFDLVGVPGMGGFDGVSVTAPSLTSITVVNGSIRNWGDDGIDFAASQAANCRVDGVLAQGNVGTGILVGFGSTVFNCSAHLNAASGFLAGDGCTIATCTAYDNTGNGIFTSSGCTILGCTAYSNTLSGISASNGCTISNCTAYQNASNGIAVGIGASISNCTARDNSAAGISTLNGAMVSNCSSYSNGGVGISVSVGSTVEGCTAATNTLDGITCTAGSVIRGNSCSGNGAGGGVGAGIHATGSDNSIEGNNCTNADRGIDVDSAGNIIIKNTCSGNTVLNWEVAAGNVCLVVQGVVGGAIAGNTGGVAPGSTDPNVNFTY